MISGTIGSKQSQVEIKENFFKLVIKNNTIMDSLSIICFQRTGLQLKTIDVAWISPENIQVQTISAKDYGKICAATSSIPMYDLGPQVGTWKKWQKKANEEQWTMDDWNNFLRDMEPEVCESDIESSDSDWQPSGEDEDEDEDYEDDSMSETDI